MFLLIFRRSFLYLLFMCAGTLTPAAKAIDCTQFKTGNMSVLGDIDQRISTLDGEEYLESLLSDAQSCNAPAKKVIELKFSLASLWGSMGIKLGEAGTYQLDVVDYYWPKRKWNRKRIAMAQLSLAEIYYKQGAFHRSHQLIEEIESLISDYGKVPEYIVENKESLKFILALALDGVMDISPQRDFITSDIKTFDDLPSIKAEETADVFTSTLVYRDALKRIIRWTQWLKYKEQPLPEESGLIYLDDLIRQLIGANYTDELYIDYAISRLSFVQDNRCDSVFSRLILDRLHKQQIESRQNDIVAKSIAAECTTGVKREQWLNDYIDEMGDFYASMPLDFSAEVYLSLSSSLNHIIEVMDWQNESKGWESLFKLMQLKLRASVVSTSSRFDPNGIANEQARKLFMEREQTKNAYFKYNQPKYFEEYSEKIAALKKHLTELDNELDENYPKLSRMSSSQIITVNNLRASLSPTQQVLMIDAVDTKSCALLISNKTISGSCSPLGSKELSITIATLQTVLQEAEGQTKPLSQRLSAQLFGSLKLDNAKPELLIVSGTALSGLPLNALYDTGNDKWLLETFNIERPMGIASLTARPANQQKLTTRRLAVADPLYNLDVEMIDTTEEEDSFRGSMQRHESSLSAIRNLERLFETEAEAEMFVSSAQRGQKLLKGNADEASVVKALQQPWDVIVFSTHTLFPGIALDLDYPGLALAPVSEEPSNDGLLSSAEIYSLSFNQAMVILAACETAQSIGKRNTLGSLLDAFLVSGSRRVLASHWKVNSRETNQFMMLLAQNLDKFRTDSQAVWETRKALVNQMPPRVWSSFDLYY